METSIERLASRQDTERPDAKGLLASFEDAHWEAAQWPLGEDSDAPYDVLADATDRRRAALLSYIEGLESRVASLETQIREAAEVAAAAIPSTWLDPILTGPDAVLGRYPYTGDDIERLLAAIRQRVRAQVLASIDSARRPS